MICPKCNTENRDGSRFCIKCGTNLQEITISNNSPSPTPASIVIPVPAPNVPASGFQTNENQVSQPKPKALNYFMYLIAAFIKPYRSFKEESEKLKRPKNTIIISLILTGMMVITNLIKMMITEIFVKQYDLTKRKIVTSIKFSNLKHLNYFDAIVKNFLIYLGIIVGVALVYYLLSLVFKKNGNFIKTIAIVITAVVPIYILGMIGAPLLGMIWEPLIAILIIIGWIYGGLVLVHLANEEVNLATPDSKIHFNLIALGVLIVGTVIIFMLQTQPIARDKSVPSIWPIVN